MTQRKLQLCIFNDSLKTQSLVLFCTIDRNDKVCQPNREWVGDMTDCGETADNRRATSHATEPNETKQSKKHQTLVDTSQDFMMIMKIDNINNYHKSSILRAT